MHGGAPVYFYPSFMGKIIFFALHEIVGV